MPIALPDIRKEFDRLLARLGAIEDPHAQLNAIYQCYFTVDENADVDTEDGQQGIDRLAEMLRDIRDLKKRAGIIRECHSKLDSAVPSTSPEPKIDHDSPLAPSTDIFQLTTLTKTSVQESGTTKVSFNVNVTSSLRGTCPTIEGDSDLNFKLRKIGFVPDRDVLFFPALKDPDLKGKSTKTANTATPFQNTADFIEAMSPKDEINPRDLIRYVAFPYRWYIEHQDELGGLLTRFPNLQHLLLVDEPALEPDEVDAKFEFVIPPTRVHRPADVIADHVYQADEIKEEIGGLRIKFDKDQGFTELSSLGKFWPNLKVQIVGIMRDGQLRQSKFFKVKDGRLEALPFTENLDKWGSSDDRPMGGKLDEDPDGVAVTMASSSSPLQVRIDQIVDRLRSIEDIALRGALISTMLPEDQARGSFSATIDDFLDYLKSLSDDAAIEAVTAIETTLITNDLELPNVDQDIADDLASITLQDDIAKPELYVELSKHKSGTIHQMVLTSLTRPNEVGRHFDLRVITSDFEVIPNIEKESASNDVAVIMDGMKFAASDILFFPARESPPLDNNYTNAINESRKTLPMTLSFATQDMSQEDKDHIKNLALPYAWYDPEQPTLEKLIVQFRNLEHLFLVDEPTVSAAALEHEMDFVKTGLEVPWADHQCEDSSITRRFADLRKDYNGILKKLEPGEEAGNKKKWMGYVRRDSALDYLAVYADTYCGPIWNPGEDGRTPKVHIVGIIRNKKLQRSKFFRVKNGLVTAVVTEQQDSVTRGSGHDAGNTSAEMLAIDIDDGFHNESEPESEDFDLEDDKGDFLEGSESAETSDDDLGLKTPLTLRENAEVAATHSGTEIQEKIGLGENGHPGYSNPAKKIVAATTNSVDSHPNGSVPKDYDIESDPDSLDNDIPDYTSDEASGDEREDEDVGGYSGEGGEDQPDNEGNGEDEGDGDERDGDERDGDEEDEKKESSDDEKSSDDEQTSDAEDSSTAQEEDSENDAEKSQDEQGEEYEGEDEAEETGEIMDAVMP